MRTRAAAGGCGWLRGGAAGALACAGFRLASARTLCPSVVWRWILTRPKARGASCLMKSRKKERKPAQCESACRREGRAGAGSGVEGWRWRWSRARDRRLQHRVHVARVAQVEQSGGAGRQRPRQRRVRHARRLARRRRRHLQLERLQLGTQRGEPRLVAEDPVVARVAVDGLAHDVDDALVPTREVVVPRVPAAELGVVGPPAAADVTAVQADPHAVGGAADLALPAERAAQRGERLRERRPQVRAGVAHGVVARPAGGTQELTEQMRLINFGLARRRRKKSWVRAPYRELGFRLLFLARMFEPHIGNSGTGNLSSSSFLSVRLVLPDGEPEIGNSDFARPRSSVASSSPPPRAACISGAPAVFACIVLPMCLLRRSLAPWVLVASSPMSGAHQREL